MIFLGIFFLLVEGRNRRAGLALESPTESVRVSMTFAGLKRRYARPPKKAMKFTADTLRLVRDHLMGGDPVSLKNFRMAAWAVASWHTMGRYEELAKVRFENCLLYTSPSPRDQRGSRMPSSA